MSANLRAGDVNWRNYGACAQPGADPDDWFPERTTHRGQPTHEYLRQVEQAKAQCLACPVLDDCERDILKMREGVGAEGVIAAMTIEERRERRGENPQPTPVTDTVTRAPRVWDDCGTWAGRTRHGRRKELLCGACHAFEVARDRARRERLKAEQQAKEAAA